MARSFLDSTQYSTTSILRYERFFGPGYVSTGGAETTKVPPPLPLRLPLRSSMNAASPAALDHSRVRWLEHSELHLMHRCVHVRERLLAPHPHASNR